jgi:CXXX repeat modification system protein
MKEIEIGYVTEEEKDEILNIYKRLEALKLLRHIIESHEIESESLLYKKVNEDYEIIQEKYNLWWDTIAEKYKLPKESNGYWEIDFYTNKVKLVIFDN